MKAAHASLRGQAWPMGATPTTWQGERGVNFAVFSRNASAVFCCLFDSPDGAQTDRIELPECTDGVWHGFVPGLRVGQLYGLRADGPFDPLSGHRFNVARLLIDPYARELIGDTRHLSREVDSFPPPPTGVDLLPLPPAGEGGGEGERIPKARVVDIESELAAGAAIAPSPRILLEHTVLYEAHVKGLTRLHPHVPELMRGTYAGLASASMLAHYRMLGITSVCLMPVHLHIDELHLLKLGLTNYWGYNTLAFFIPDPGYATQGASPDAVRNEFRAMVDALHRNGIEVILDVVYNHTAEGGADGPTLSWRGLDNASSYALDGSGSFLNFTGCGNSIRAGEPRMVQLVLDSLRWWVQAFGVDGFRFDLATTLGRDPALHNNFNPNAALFTAMAQDPVLCRVKRIAEPWDVAPGGYQLGAFSPGWQEWNDRFRDTARSYWLGHECTPGQLARRMTGSNDTFHHSGRNPLASINLITAHDGFTLADVTSYRYRHNEANGENNRDGHAHNFSANASVEGPTDDAAVLQRRAAWQRALLATLLLAQGTPQLLAGDEIGNSQRGNNNAYCQDNETAWLDWPNANERLVALVCALTALRKRYPAFRHPRWFEGHPFHEAGHPYQPGGDIAWLRPDGLAMSDQDWDDPWERSFAYVIEVGEGERAASERVMVLLHANESTLTFVLPQGPWHLALDTAAPEWSSSSPRRRGSRAPWMPAFAGTTGSYELTGPAVGVLIQPIEK